jgi:hypothetical protein
MRVREYLEGMGKYDDVKFTIAKAVKDESTPHYHAEYNDECPIWTVNDHLNKFKSIGHEELMSAIVLNDMCPYIAWLSGVDHNNRINKGWLTSLLVVKEADFALLYPSEEQRKSLEEHIEKKLRK